MSFGATVTSAAHSIHFTPSIPSAVRARRVRHAVCYVTLVASACCCDESLISVDWNSALMMIVNGDTPEHMDMLQDGFIRQLLDEKWKTFVRVRSIVVIPPCLLLPPSPSLPPYFPLILSFSPSHSLSVILSHSLSLSLSPSHSITLNISHTINLSLNLYHSKNL